MRNALSADVCGITGLGQLLERDIGRLWFARWAPACDLTRTLLRLLGLANYALYPAFL